jgi:hexosaminidase
MNKVLLFLFLFLSITVKSQTVPPIIPLPAEFQKTEGEFILSHKTKIFVGDLSLKEEAYFLQKELLHQEIPLSISTEETGAGVQLVIDNELGNSYQLKVTNRSVSIASGSDEGIFYGIISLLQIANQEGLSDGKIVLPLWEIKDRPVYAWRGIMLDESRYFFGMAKVKQILDWMAYYKLNKFHWHLTDSPGWRIQIKKYPKLTLVGGIGNQSDPFAPAEYYTQEEIKEIVAYAGERKIEVIPEIDMPGHASAANRAYPQFSGGGSEKYPEFTFHPAKDDTYQYLTDILREINALFPSNMIHLGGDEVSFGNEKWHTDPEIESLMKNERLENLKEVENYFFQRMADSLLTLDNIVLAWDEMASASLDKNKTILFWWRHDQPQQLTTALNNQYPVIICPRIPFYLDFVQKDSHQYGRKWAGAFSPLEDVYGFTLDGLNIPSDQNNLVLGIQANLWTETVHNEQRLDFLLFPRIAAVAEVAWTQENHKNYEHFLSRLEQHLPLYKKDLIYYFDPFQPEKHPEPIYQP